MPARPSFNAIPPTEAEAIHVYDRSLRRAQALEALGAPMPRLGLGLLLGVCLGATGTAYGLLAQSWGQMLLAWLAAAGAFSAWHAWAAVRDLQARVDALQALLRQAESEGR